MQFSFFTALFWPLLEPVESYEAREILMLLYKFAAVPT